MYIRRLAPGFLLPFVLAACAENERSAFDPSSDMKPPDLLGFAVVTNAAGTEAWVEWEADEPARAVVEYGDAMNALHRHSYAGAREFATNGRTRLLAAEPSRSYEYAVRMWDRAGNESSLMLPSVPTLDTPALVDGELMLLAMIDVGWGDAIYLEIPHAGSPGGFSNVLIDAGHPLDGMKVLDFFDRHGVTDLDFASLSHIHGDHVGGYYGDGFLNEDGLIVDRGGGHPAVPIPIGTFIDFDDKTAINSPYANLISALAVHPSLGEYVVVGWGESSNTLDALKWGDAEIHLLAAGRKPYLDVEHTYSQNAGSVENNDSMVWRVRYGDFVALLTGDAEFSTEQFIQNHWSSDFLRAHLLKLGHHGSNDASSERWVDFVTPMVGFIPNAVSENPGVEHPYVLQRLRNRSIDYYASDRVIPNRDRSLPGVRGDLLVYTDGTDFTIVVENVRYE